MRIRPLALVATTLLIGSSSLTAQTPTVPASDSSARQLGDSTAQRLHRVRIIDRRSSSYAPPSSTRTATKTDTPHRDVPQSATVLTRGFMSDKAIQTMSQAVEFVPGITILLGEGHHDQPVIRGNSTTADLFVDGVRDDAEYSRDMYNIERVEAIKGSNAMVFGRGGGGGVINRVTKEAVFAPLGSLSLETGSYAHQRSTLDVGQALGNTVAVRVNGFGEHSGGFRQSAMNKRFGVNPTATILASPATLLRVDYEHFDNTQNVDRGIPSFAGRPSPAPISQFFGDPGVSHAFVHVDDAGIVAEQALGSRVTVRNHARWASYDKFYQNVFPGSAVDSTGTTLNLSGYNHAQRRDNLINQTDLTGIVSTGGVTHTLLAGMELARERTTDYRRTGYFGGTATTQPVPFANPSIDATIEFRQSATDNDNNSHADIGALYVQDQAALSPHWQVVAGLRVERFGMHFHNNRSSIDLARDDRLVSPRAGLIFKPVEPLSIYASASVSHLPSSGDQFASLTVTTQTLEPEDFHNYELGAKWDLADALSLTAAVYRLDRTNSQAPDPNTPGLVVQTGARRTNGLELGASGNLTDDWSIAAGYAVQRAFVVATTTAAPAGNSVQNVPRNTLSLWNRYQITPVFGAALGVVSQGRSYAAIDNTVTLPGFTRTDAALFVRLASTLRAQLNVENLLDVRYYPTSQGNNQIMPGAPRSLLVSLTANR
jgi:catecholate siderophore receptor